MYYICKNIYIFLSILILYMYFLCIKLFGVINSLRWCKLLIRAEPYAVFCHQNVCEVISSTLGMNLLSMSLSFYAHTAIHLLQNNEGHEQHKIIIHYNTVLDLVEVSQQYKDKL